MLETEREGRQSTAEQLHEEFPGKRKRQLTVKCSVYWIYFLEVKKKQQKKDWQIDWIDIKFRCFLKIYSLSWIPNMKHSDIQKQQGTVARHRFWNNNGYMRHTYETMSTWDIWNNVYMRHTYETMGTWDIHSFISLKEIQSPFLKVVRNQVLFIYCDAVLK